MYKYKNATLVALLAFYILFRSSFGSLFETGIYITGGSMLLLCMRIKDTSKYLKYVAIPMVLFAAYIVWITLGSMWVLIQ